MKVLELRYNEKTKKWEERKEPYCTIECATKEDYERLKRLVERGR